ncbi:uncharacterized protein Bfra_001339 [Botrytis fragariae]|uniref:Uncharacterized protein n=1 Tax=Botrytis fragariae TaxID=1964551 RepID=A0A8H6B0B7_9HELO|nr:uncharacterized protein Bfra_001339 [Botrytis fragariae]KAF5876981.1 hypothetical protein Bfra_001339 [Botrytis fragariae]
MGTRLRVLWDDFNAMSRSGFRPSRTASGKVDMGNHRSLGQLSVIHNVKRRECLLTMLQAFNEESLTPYPVKTPVPAGQIVHSRVAEHFINPFGSDYPHSVARIPQTGKLPKYILILTVKKDRLEISWLLRSSLTLEVPEVPGWVRFSRARTNYHCP